MCFLGVTYMMLIVVFIIREVIPDIGEYTLDMKRRHKIVRDTKYYRKLEEGEQE